MEPASGKTQELHTDAASDDAGPGQIYGHCTFLVPKTDQVLDERTYRRLWAWAEGCGLFFLRIPVEKDHRSGSLHEGKAMGDHQPWARKGAATSPGMGLLV